MNNSIKGFCLVSYNSVIDGGKEVDRFDVLLFLREPDSFLLGEINQNKLKFLVIIYSLRIDQQVILVMIIM